MANCCVGIILFAGAAFGEYLLFSYGLKNYDISTNYKNLAIFVGLGLCLPSLCCCAFKLRDD